MIIAIASDHAGYEIKKKLVEMLSSEHKIMDFGCFSEQSCDYPDYAMQVIKAIKRKEAQRGILICATGVGMSIVANKYSGIYAGLCYCREVSTLISEHNFANVICLPSRISINGKKIDIDEIYEWVKNWLNTENSNQERHIRRFNKILEIEKENFKKI